MCTAAVPTRGVNWVFKLGTDLKVLLDSMETSTGDIKWVFIPSVETVVEVIGVEVMQGDADDTSTQWVLMDVGEQGSNSSGVTASRKYSDKDKKWLESSFMALNETNSVRSPLCNLSCGYLLRKRLNHPSDILSFLNMPFSRAAVSTTALNCFLVLPYPIL